MRTHSMVPPNGSGAAWTNDNGTMAASHQVAASNFNDTTHEGKYGATIERRTGAGGLRHIQFIKYAGVDFPSSVSFNVAPPTGFANDGTWLPIWYLPWTSLKVLSFDIPRIPSSVVDPDDEEYPRFFFTAGINGCSVFANGDPKGPTVSHAGITGALSRSAGEFWRMQMAKTKSGYAASAIKGEVNTHDYMFKGGNSQALAEKYAKFLQGDSKEFNMEVQSPFGCVFGIRFGSSWTLYLQRNVVLRKIRFYKQGDLNANNDINPNRMDHYAKDTGLYATKVSTTIQPKKFGPIKTGTKEVSIYSTTQTFSMPLDIAEMYPNRNNLGDLQDLFKAR